MQMSICSTGADTSSTEADASSSESETDTGSPGATTDVDSSASETGSGTETTEEAGQQTADTMTANTDLDPAEELGGPGEATESGPRLQVRGDLDSGSSSSIHLSTALVLAMVSIAAVTLAVYATKDGVRRAWYSHMNYVPA